LLQLKGYIIIPKYYKFLMRRGIILGAIIGFLTGLALQSYGPLTTGMAVADGYHVLAVTFALTLFIAALCGIIGAFVGALFEEGLQFFRH
jgi:hypothetical protein